MVLAQAGRPGWDYVLIGRAGATAERPFAALLEDLRQALDRVHRPAHGTRRPAPAAAQPRSSAPSGHQR